MYLIMPLSKRTSKTESQEHRSKLHSALQAPNSPHRLNIAPHQGHSTSKNIS